MYNDFQQLSIISLVLFYLLINLYFKNKINILIFLLNTLFISFLVKNKINALIIAYIICIIYNIVKNFHLMENFESKIDYNKNNKNNKNHKLDLSERVVDKYISKLKRQQPTKIATRQVKISELLPTKVDLCSKKLNNMKNNKEILEKPIVITNDNFIIDGHYRWHINNNLNNEYIKATIISSDIKNFMKDITQYKREYNIDELGKFTIDKNKINQAKNSIKIITENINLLNDYIKDLDKINVV